MFTALHAARSRLRRIAGAMTPQEWTRFSAMFAFILAVNVVGWGIYVLYVMPHHFAYKGEDGSAGLGIVIYPISYLINRARGIDLGLAFRELPPE